MRLQSVLSILAYFSLLQCASSEIQLAQFPILALQNQSLSKKVAIIGAGAAGSSAAYYLRRYAAEARVPLEITIYDRNTYIGGRSTTAYAFESEDEPTPSSEHPRIPLELGASIFVSVNRILVDAVDEFNLSTSRSATHSDERETLGIWNGHEFIFTQRLGGSKWQSWWSTARLVWRYGSSPYRTLKLMQSTVGAFFRLYDEPLFPWRNGLSEAVAEIGLLDVTTSSGRDLLKRNYISDIFSTEIVQASTRVNYASNLGIIHGLETMVCMATDGAMAVEGGNWQIFANMVAASEAKVHLGRTVTMVEALKENIGYRVHYSSGRSSTDIRSATTDFDAIILTAPFHQTGINFDPPPSHVPDEIDYVNLHVTLFSSPHKLSPLQFNLAPHEKVPEIVLTTLPPDEQDSFEKLQKGVGSAGFFSISRLQSALNIHVQPPRKEYLYKIFSPEPVNSTSLYKILGLSDEALDEENLSMVGTRKNKDIPWIYRKLWQSYPYLPPRVTFEPQRLQPGLWYTSGIESFISTMETSSLSGKNVAKLIVEGWT